MNEDDEWIKLKLRNDLSGLDDVFEFMEDVYDKIDGVKYPRSQKGMTVSMYYGCMKTLIEKGELITEEEYTQR
tara:strand:- start:2165 stop:2383 length:219 start_codon:yes stop_codon:yes gene_type:complete